MPATNAARLKSLGATGLGGTSAERVCIVGGGGLTGPGETLVTRAAPRKI